MTFIECYNFFSNFPNEFLLASVPCNFRTQARQVALRNKRCSITFRTDKKNLRYYKFQQDEQTALIVSIRISMLIPLFIYQEFKVARTSYFGNKTSIFESLIL